MSELQRGTPPLKRRYHITKLSSLKPIISVCVSRQLMRFAGGNKACLEFTSIQIRGPREVRYLTKASLSKPVEKEFLGHRPDFFTIGSGGCGLLAGGLSQFHRNAKAEPLEGPTKLLMLRDRYYASSAVELPLERWADRSKFPSTF